MGAQKVPQKNGFSRQLDGAWHGGAAYWQPLANVNWQVFTPARKHWT